MALTDENGMVMPVTPMYGLVTMMGIQVPSCQEQSKRKAWQMYCPHLMNC